MSTKSKPTSEEIRQKGLALIRRAKQQMLDEQNEIRCSLGALVVQHVEGEINFKVFQAEVKKITGKEFTPNTKFSEIIAAGDEENK